MVITSLSAFLYSLLTIRSIIGDLKMVGNPYKLSLIALRSLDEGSLYLTFVYNTYVKCDHFDDTRFLISNFYPISELTTIAFTTIEERNEFNDILSLYIDEVDNKGNLFNWHQSTSPDSLLCL